MIGRAFLPGDPIPATVTHAYCAPCDLVFNPAATHHQHPIVEVVLPDYQRSVDLAEMVRQAFT